MKFIKTLLTLLTISSTALMANAQDSTRKADTTYWKKGAKASLTFTQTTLSNWSAGGQNSVSFNSGLNAFANYKKNKTTFENSLELGYGIIQQGSGNIQKSDDKIIFTSKFGHKISKDKGLYWSSLVDFKTQFYQGVNINDDGSESKISDFMAPGFLTVSTGLEYKPNDWFSLLYAPVTGKMTFVNIQRFADRGDYGVEPAMKDASGTIIPGTGEKFRAEFGSFMKILFAKDLIKGVNLETKVELFAAYDENFGNVDVNWQNALTLKVNDWLMTSFITQLMYDDDTKIATEFDANGEATKSSPLVQYKQILGVGLTFKVGN